MIDAPDPAYIPKEIIDSALDFIEGGLRDQKKVLVHCNLGESRAPTIGFLYLAAFTAVLPDNILHAEQRFCELYPPYRPGAGVHGFLRLHFDSYRRRLKQ